MSYIASRSFFFFFNDTATTEIYTLSLHDALPISRGTGQLAASPDLELHVVHRGAEGDLEQRHRVPHPDVGARPRDHGVAHREAFGSQDVALLAIRVVQQRDARCPVRVVLHRRHLGGNAELFAPEVDPSIATLVAAALPPVGDVALVVAPARPPQRL